MAGAPTPLPPPPPPPPPASPAPRTLLCVLCVVLWTAVFAAAAAAAPADIQNVTERADLPVLPTPPPPPAGCWHEGRLHGEEQAVATREPCLGCVCRRGALRCQLRVCAALPEPPPHGCTLLRRPRACCPALRCEGDAEIPDDNIKDLSLTQRQTTEHGISSIEAIYESENMRNADEDDMYTEEQNSTTPTNSFTIGDTNNENNQQIEVPESKFTEAFEGRSNREMISGTKPIEEDNDKLLPCNISGKQDENTTVQISTETEETTTQTTEKTETTLQSTTTEMTSIEPTETTTKLSTFPTTTDITDNRENETTDIASTTTMEPTTLTTITTTVTLNVTTGKIPEQDSTSENVVKVISEKVSSNETMKNETKIQERIEPTAQAGQLSSTFIDDVITLGPESDFTIERNGITTEQSNIPNSIQTDSTFMIPTTVIMPDELDIVNITLHKNVSIVEHDKTNNTVNASLLPVRAIPAEIEAILNISQKKDEDYEYDYNEPSLPPSLPGVRIIPFVAADAVVEDKNSPTVYPQDKQRPTDSPIFYKVSHPNLFSPPVETEGGFIPREPILDGPFYESKFDVPYPTTGVNIPSGHLSLDITAGSILPPAITIPPKNEDERCLSNDQEYRHGELVAQTDPCLRCICYYGEVLCQASKCPPIKPGCRRLRHKDRRSCCGRIVCGDGGESPTVVLDGAGAGGSGGSQAGGTGAGATGAPLLGPLVPPITVADGVVTPDPFRDVIRTEEAPDLPALIGDMMPYLLEQHRTATTSAATTTTSTTTSTTPRTTETTTTASATTSLPATTPTTATTSTATTRKPDVAASKNDFDPDDDDVDDDGFSFDSVLQFLFPGDSTPAFTTTPPPTTTLSQDVLPNATSLESDADPDPGNATQELPGALNSTHQLLEIFNISLDVEDGGAGGAGAAGAGAAEGGGAGGAAAAAAAAAAAGGNTLGELPADPGAASGLLKLAGCNIYGRMYRVGRIISELSGPCLECMCTEVGVQCRALDC